MAIPTLASVTPGAGPASGGDLVRLVGTGFAPRVAVRLGGRAATIVAVREEAGASLADVRTPAHEAGVVDVELQNLDADDVPGSTASRAPPSRGKQTSLASSASCFAS
jgi:hypothetical protein